MKTKIYIAGNRIHHDIVIYATSDDDCKDAFAEVIGYRDYKHMLEKEGEEAAKVDCVALKELEGVNNV